MIHTDVGFTGTREGIVEAQWRAFQMAIENLLRGDEPTVFRHGCCVGSDSMAACYVRDFYPNCTVIGHPPRVRKLLSKDAVAASHLLMDEEDYLERDHTIVDCCSLLIATPRQRTNFTRSGTWATIRYALKTGRPCQVIGPDGEITVPS